MPRLDLTIGFSKTEVEDILAANKAELKKVLSAHGDGGVSVTKRSLADIKETISDCQRALQILAPLEYPTPDDSTRSRRAVAQITTCIP